MQNKGNPISLQREMYVSITKKRYYLKAVFHMLIAILRVPQHSLISTVLALEYIVPEYICVSVFAYECNVFNEEVIVFSSS